MSAVLVTACFRPLPPSWNGPIVALFGAWAKAQTGLVFSCFGHGCQRSLSAGVGIGSTYSVRPLLLPGSVGRVSGGVMVPDGAVR